MPTPSKRILYVGSKFTFSHKFVKDDDPNTGIADSNAIASCTISIYESRDGIYDTAVITGRTATVSSSTVSYQVIDTGDYKVTDVPRDCLGVWTATLTSPADEIIKKFHFMVRDARDERQI